MFGRKKDKDTQPKQSFLDSVVNKALQDSGAGNLGGLGLSGALGLAMDAMSGGARTYSLADHPGMSPAKATIVANEGWNGGETIQDVILKHYQFIVDVHPDNTADPAFRTELSCWCDWENHPDVGHIVPAGYTPGTKDAALLLAGDPRFDWNLKRANDANKAATTREALLNAPPDTPPPTQ